MPMEESSLGDYLSELSPASVAPSPPPKDYPPQNGGRTKSPETDPISPTPWSKLSAVERSNALRIARMNPHLQFMAGPLLRYDTVDENGVWNGAVLVVSACLSVFLLS
jgi:hypothetical protein